MAASPVALVLAELEALMDMLRAEEDVKVRALVRQVPGTPAEDQVESAAALLAVRTAPVWEPQMERQVSAPLAHNPAQPVVRRQVVHRAGLVVHRVAREV